MHAPEGRGVSHGALVVPAHLRAQGHALAVELQELLEQLRHRAEVPPPGARWDRCAGAFEEPRDKTPLAASGPAYKRV